LTAGQAELTVRQVSYLPTGKENRMAGDPPPTAPNGAPIQAEGLVKSFGETHAVRDVSLSVPEGTILGVLGPNGAGKTTTVRMLTTLSRPDAGWARVAGHDVVAEPRAVRRRIGVTGQNATLDENLTGRENLEMVAQLGGAPRATARTRAVEMLERFELPHAADRVVKGYSGGMRRRLDLAASLVGRPSVLFLDEPTTGLDPTSRAGMWDIIRELVADGTTVLLTTQYLDEADLLADRIVVIDQGTVIAEGTSQQLKARVGGERLQLVLSAPDPSVRDLLAPLAAGEVVVDGRTVTMPVDPVPGLATTVVRVLDGAGISVDDVEMRRPSLDDVFFTLTGHAAEPASAADDDPLPELEGAAR
jgi:ABC-2 type transport system ATP-binding protein